MHEHARARTKAHGGASGSQRGTRARRHTRKDLTRAKAGGLLRAGRSCEKFPPSTAHHAPLAPVSWLIASTRASMAPMTPATAQLIIALLLGIGLLTLAIGATVLVVSIRVFHAGRPELTAAQEYATGGHPIDLGLRHGQPFRPNTLVRVFSAEEVRTIGSQPLTDLQRVGKLAHQLPVVLPTGPTPPGGTPQPPRRHLPTGARRSPAFVAPIVDRPTMDLPPIPDSTSAYHVDDIGRIWAKTPATHKLETGTEAI